jgi:cyanophycin synthetase
VRAGIAEGARCTNVETVLDEMEATRYALDMGHEGDVVVVCVDHANDVWKELQRRQHGGASVGESSPTIDTLDDEMEEMVAIEVDG